MYGLQRGMGLAEGCCPPRPPPQQELTQGLSDGSHFYKYGFVACADIEIADAGDKLLSGRRGGVGAFTNILSKVPQIRINAFVFSSLGVFGGGAPAVWGTQPSSTLERLRRLPPNKIGCLPRAPPPPEASSQRLFLHHLFSVTHLQLNCGGCCISPP